MDAFLSVQLASLSLHRAFPLDPAHPNRHLSGCRLHLKPPLRARWVGGEKGSQQPAASLVPLQGEDQKLPGRASSGLLYLSAWSPGPLSHRSLIFTPMSFCQNASAVPLAASPASPFLQWLRSKSSRGHSLECKPSTGS